MKEVTIMKPAKDFLRRPFTTRVPQLLVQSIIIGLIIGMIVSIFRFVIDKSIHFLYFLYPYLAAHPQWISLYTIFTFFICILVSKIIKPYLLDLSGSGIPQVEATLMGEHEVEWFPVLWRKFVGGLLVSSMGLFLGREGPCIQMGALVGKVLQKTFLNVVKKIDAYFNALELRLALVQRSQPHLQVYFFLLKSLHILLNLKNVLVP